MVSMTVADLLDSASIASACERYDVARLRVFGSVLTDRFDPEHSDVDFLVDYKPEAERTFQALFGLRDELASIVGHPVDLVEARNLRNPYVAKSVFNAARDVYAA